MVSWQVLPDCSRVRASPTSQSFIGVSCSQCKEFNSIPAQNCRVKAIRPPRHRCKAITDPQQLMFWAVEAAEDPDLAFRIISLAAIDVGIAALLTANIINTWPLRDKRQPNLDDYASRQNASDRSSGLLGSLKAFIAETASNIPTGFSLLLLAEQESAVTAEYGKLEECLLQALMEDKDLAAAFLQLFIRGFKRTWLANTISEAVMSSFQAQQCSLDATAILLERVSQPEAEFRAPLETMMVNAELMEAIGIYSLVVVLKAKKGFQWIQSLVYYLS